MIDWDKLNQEIDEIMDEIGNDEDALDDFDDEDDDDFHFDGGGTPIPLAA